MYRPFLAAGAFDFLLSEAVAVFLFPGALCSKWPGGGGSSIVPERSRDTKTKCENKRDVSVSLMRCSTSVLLQTAQLAQLT